MTKRELVDELVEIVGEIRESRDIEVALAASVLCSLIGSLEAKSVEALSNLTAAFSMSELERIRQVMANEVRH